MKKFTVLALILALAISVTGCFGGESKLYNAFNKMQDVTSLESDIELGFTLKGEGLLEEQQLILDQVAAMVNTTKLTMHQRSEQNKDKSVVKAEVDTNMNLAGMGMDIKTWVDMDMSTDEFKMVEIIKMPQMLMGTMFPDDPAKEYIVYDIGEMIGAENEEMNFNELMKFTKEFQPKLMEFIKEIQKDFKPEFDMVNQKDDKVINKERIKVYELKLDDATLKELVTYAVDYSLDNETIIEFIKEYMNAIMNTGLVPEAEKETAQIEIKDGIEELEKQLPELKVKFHEFMEKYKDVKILGDKGITIEFGINKEGYIVREIGNIDLRVDLEQIAKFAKQEAPQVKGIINLGINYTANNYNINSKDVKVEMPPVDENNSITFMEMMEMQMNQMEQISAPSPEPVQLP